MFRSLLIRLALICICGCSGPNFTHIGNGVAVPAGAIEEYAASNGISREEAKQRMVEEIKQGKQNSNGDK